MKNIARMVRKLIVFPLLLISVVAFANQDLLQGDWHSHDKKTGKVSSTITIWKQKGKYFGKISKIYSVNGANKSDTCKKCTGARYAKPILGLTIIRDMQRAKDNKYKKGYILDPRDGKEYHCVLAPSADGRRLYVRGYIGFALFGKTTVWTRALKNTQES